MNASNRPMRWMAGPLAAAMLLAAIAPAAQADHWRGRDTPRPRRSSGSGRGRGREAGGLSQADAGGNAESPPSTGGPSGP